MIRYAIPLATLLAIFALALGYILGSLWLWLGLTIVLGLLWLVGQWRAWSWLDSPMLVTFAALAGLGVFLRVSPFLMLFSLVSSLAAWDLSQAGYRFRQANHITDEALLQRTHLRRLGTVAVLGLLLGSLTLSLQLQLNLGWAIGLGALVIIGLSRVVRGVRREGE